MTTRNSCTTATTATAAAATAVVVMIKRFVERIQRQMAKHPYVSTALTVLAINLVSRFAKSGQFSSYQQYSSQPYPTSFFPLQSPVVDYPYGNVADVSKILLEEETMFVMFYAPWCARSLELKHEFEKAAKYFENEILFVSINCWHRLSTCRQQNIFMSFPVFYFYVLGQEGFRYNGVTRADFMVEFILRMLHPLTYISSKEKLTEFMSSHDTSVVGYFDMTSASSPPPPAFNQFYSAALHTYEKDHKNVIPFGILTNADVAEQLKILDPPSVALIRSLNDSLRFPIDENFTASALSTWTLATRQQPVVKWIYPSGSKSLVLSLDIRRGPAVVLFLPATPLSPRNHYMALLRQIGLTYYNCNQSSVVSGMVTTDVYNVAKNFLRQQVLEKLCRQTSHVDTWSSAMTKKKMVPLKSCCMTAKDSLCQYCLHYHNSHPSSAKDCSEIPLPSFVLSFPPECVETTVNYNPSEFASYCCGHLHQRHGATQRPGGKSKWDGVPTDEEEDASSGKPFAQERRGHRHLEARCRALQKSRSFGWNAGHGTDNDLQLLGPDDFSADFVGLGCRTNQTIRFFAMDSVHSHMFMESLGVDARPETDKLTMVLYHFKNELIHVMKSRFQPQNIVNFIKNFTVGSLPAFRRAAKDQPSSVELCADQTQQICVTEVTSKSFRKIVLNNNKDVLLLYYTPWCGFCIGFSHIFLTLAYQFRSVPSIVFARINCDANDLPWQYMATEYPTLILYPAHSKSDSVLFPPHQPKTLPNLVRFVLRSSSNLLILDSSLSVCSRDCISTTRNLSAVRMETLFHEMESTSLEISSALSHRHRLEADISEMASTGAGSERLESLENRLKHALTLERLLGKKLFELRLKWSSVQYLHGVLQSYAEPHLDADTLLSIAQHNTMYKSRLKNYELL